MADLKHITLTADGNLCLRCKEFFINRMQRYAL